MVIEDKSLNIDAINKSVEDIPQVKVGSGGAPLYDAASSLFWMIPQLADEITPFGRGVKQRDMQLRHFILTEPIFASALGVICSRNAAFSWKLEGPEDKVRSYSKVLEASNHGRGWVDLMIKTSMDLYTQDNAAFIEVVREEDDEDSEILELNHLDAARCTHTGDPRIPVLYLDRKGKTHYMKWYQVIPLAEMPVAIEGLYGQQYCVLSRLLRAAEIIKNISIYDYERTGGRHTRAIHLVRGITAGQIQDAIDEMVIRLNARGAQRYSQPLIVGSVDPKAEVGHDTLELASLPDNFDREAAFKWYISQIAMAFLEDYQSFAPLPGGNLGSSAQSEVLHAKARGKGPALFQKIITHAFNFQVLPDDVMFSFDEQDLAQEEANANIKKLRAEERQIRILSREITPGAARQLALDANDLPEELFEALGGDDVTANVMVAGDVSPDAVLGMENAPRTPPISDIGELKPKPPPTQPQTQQRRNDARPRGSARTPVN